MRWLARNWWGWLLAVVATPVSAQEWRTDFSRHIVPLDEIVSGGPPRDGIPPIDRPRFVSVADANRWLGAREPVAVVRVSARTRIYPIQILMWHEIVNDVVAGQPIAVTFCPLCNTTIAFDRRLAGDTVLDFGTTGRLRHSDLVMYDRLTETWWQQASGEGLVGALAGRRLRMIPAPVLAWRDARDAYPDAEVLSRATGAARPYGQNPYVRYDSERAPLAGFFRRQPDGRLPAMERVVVVAHGSGGVAVPFTALRDRRLAQWTREGERIVVFWAPGAASALDTRDIAQGADVGAGVAYRPIVADRALTFCSHRDGTFRDRETDSRWSITGQARDGPLAGRSLEPVVHGNHFWFAWSVFQPDTEVLQLPDASC
ncbi:MAG: DUF3179 domain-containing protein [Gemmatimonadales bacterium]